MVNGQFANIQLQRLLTIDYGHCPFPFALCLLPIAY